MSYILFTLLQKLRQADENCKEQWAPKAEKMGGAASIVEPHAPTIGVAVIVIAIVAVLEYYQITKLKKKVKFHIGVGEQSHGMQMYHTNMHGQANPQFYFNGIPASKRFSTLGGKPPVININSPFDQATTPPGHTASGVE